MSQLNEAHTALGLYHALKKTLRKQKDDRVQLLWKFETQGWYSEELVEEYTEREAVIHTSMLRALKSVEELTN